jgi:EAL domain-containing protein (putative c-di-GMP-specific phosphodiesterase class I)/GGDEF domain-containing protein
VSPPPRRPKALRTVPPYPQVPAQRGDGPAPTGGAWFSYLAANDEATWSPELSALLGYPPPTGGAGRASMLRSVHRDDHAKALHALATAWTRQEQVLTTLRLVRADGSWFDVDCQLEAVTGPDGPRGVKGLVYDVSARERARREVARLTRRSESVRATLIDRDPGTGLLTRARFADELDRAVRAGAGAVVVLRVEPERRPDRGGLRPDRALELLHRAARLVETVAQPDDHVGRVGPNEIGVLLPGRSWPVARRSAELFVEALRAHPYVLPEGWLRAQAYAGVVRYRPGDAVGSLDLLIDAEHAWREARDSFRPVAHVGQPVAAQQRQGSYRGRVATALGAAGFTLFAQPILELQTNTVARHELLLRVVDEVNGPHSPIAVLDTAERLDAVFEIDLWVMERAMQLAQQHPTRALQVNLSGRSVGDPRLTGAVDRLLDRYGVDPEQLTFEITETALIGNLSEARRFSDRIRDLGAQLALDDFGSGYASFRYLKQFPIDLVKIDGEYVAELAHNPQDQVLVRALVQVCQAYGIHTVAEFVQDERTLRLLREFGVDYAQGFLIGRPEPAELLLSEAPPRSVREERRPGG